MGWNLLYNGREIEMDMEEGQRNGGGGLKYWV
jgi:hypothetical protein